MSLARARGARRGKVSNRRVKYLTAARRLFPRARVALLAFPEVIGVSVGLQQVDGVETGEAAFVVTVRRKLKRLKPAHRLPRELFGVPVDVQESPVPSLKRVIAGGTRTRQPGHLGFMARGEHDEDYAVTALHVLVSEMDGQVFAFDRGPYFPVEVPRGHGFEEIGRLAAGEFSRDADIACIRLHENHAAAPELLGTKTALGAPINPGRVNLNVSATLVIPDGPGELAATLIHYPYEGAFSCDAGVLDFRNLVKFRVAAPRIIDGWSGSVLFGANNRRPIALISFGTGRPDVNGHSYAYGFPLHVHYTAWSLRPLDRAHV